MITARGFLKGVGIGVTILALPFVIEVLLNAYELNRNPWTKPGAIVTDGGAVREGLNRRLFREIRFRSTGMRIYFTASDLSEAEADALVSGVSGMLRVLKDDEEQLAHAFTLEQILRRNVGGLDSLEGLAGGTTMDIMDKYDVECRVVPATEEDAAAARRLHVREFDVGEAVELAFVFSGNIPETGTLRFSYSQCPRSLLHGTFLERVAGRIKRALH